MKKCLSFIFAGLILGFSINSFAIDKMLLDKYFSTMGAHNKVMGALAIDSCGVEIYNNSIGDSGLTYEIGSISKTFAAVIAMNAIETGKLTYDTPLSKYYPQIKNADKITIKDLLTHRSGIKSYTADDTYQRWHGQAQTETEMVGRIASYEPDFNPGEKFQYSNSNYTLLAYIFTKIYGKPYSRILNDIIIAPLGLKHTFFPEATNEKMAKSYKFFDKWRVEDSTHPSCIIGAAGIQSTPSDLNKFFAALIEGKLVGRKSLKDMTEIKDGMGVALISVPFNKQIGYGFSGGIDGFNSISIYFPATKIAYTFLSNGLNCILNDITIDMLTAASGDKIQIPSFDSIDIPDSVLRSYAGTYSTATLPIKMMITLSGKTLMGQGSGQPAFPLTPISYDTFVFKAAGIKITFQPLNKTLSLQQGGATFLLNKE